MVQDSLDNSELLTEVQHLVYKHQTELRVKDEQIKSKKDYKMDCLCIRYYLLCRCFDLPTLDK